MSVPKTILVDLYDPHQAKRLLDVAIGIARPHSAHIIGLFVLPPPLIIGAGMPGAPSPLIIDHVRKHVQKNVDVVKVIFDAAIAGSGCVGEWRVEDAENSSVSEVLLAHARSADLIVDSQPIGHADELDANDLADLLVIESGRPVIIVPVNGPLLPIGRRIVVGWNGRREAARAAFDALPLLRGAEAVKVVWVNAGDDPGVAGDVPTADLCTALARHGVHVEGSDTTPEAFNAGEALLKEVGAFRADLLVMGCYGHSRLREFVFGGATQHVLKNMCIPVLMSH